MTNVILSIEANHKTQTRDKEKSIPPFRGKSTHTGMGGTAGGHPCRQSSAGQNQIWVVERPDSLYWMVAGQCVGRKASLEGITMERKESDTTEGLN